MLLVALGLLLPANLLLSTMLLSADMLLSTDMLSTKLLLSADLLLSSRLLLQPVLRTVCDSRVRKSALLSRRMRSDISRQIRNGLGHESIATADNRGQTSHAFVDDDRLFGTRGRHTRAACASAHQIAC